MIRFGGDGQFTEVQRDLICDYIATLATLPECGEKTFTESARHHQILLIDRTAPRLREDVQGNTVEAVYPATSDYVSSRSKVIPNGLEPLFSESPWCWINLEANME
ncbi:hypothetical protein JOM56_012377 [Amanita muscaria]